MIEEPIAGIHNLLGVFSKAKDWEITRGYSYYSDLHLRILEVWMNGFEAVPKETFFAVFAALSPNNDEEGNFRDMHDAFRATKVYGGWDLFKPHTYPANKGKAFRLIFENAKPEEVLAGPKTYAFYRNMLDPWEGEYVTVDGHMVNIWNGKRVRLTEAGINQTEYNTIADGIKEVAKMHEIVPCKVQSVLWLTWRRLHGIKYSHYKNGDQGVLDL